MFLFAAVSFGFCAWQGWNVYATHDDSKLIGWKELLVTVATVCGSGAGMVTAAWAVLK